MFLFHMPATICLFFLSPAISPLRPFCALMFSITSCVYTTCYSPANKMEVVPISQHAQLIDYWY